MAPQHGGELEFQASAKETFRTQSEKSVHQKRPLISRSQNTTSGTRVTRDVQVGLQQQQRTRVQVRTLTN